MQTSVAPICQASTRLLGHLLEPEEVGVGFARAAAEGAEFAAHKTDIGEIDVAVDHVGHQIADQFAAQGVGGHQQTEQVVALGMGQPQTLLAGEYAAVERFQHWLEGSPCFSAHAGSDFGPFLGGKGLEFGWAQQTGHASSFSRCRRDGRRTAALPV